LQPEGQEEGGTTGGLVLRCCSGALLCGALLCGAVLCGAVAVLCGAVVALLCGAVLCGAVVVL